MNRDQAEFDWLSRLFTMREELRRGHRGQRRPGAGGRVPGHLVELNRLIAQMGDDG